MDPSLAVVFRKDEIVGLEHVCGVGTGRNTEAAFMDP